MSTAGLTALLTGFLVLVGVGFWLYRRGRDAARLDRARGLAEVKDEQLEAALRRPRDRDDLVERLRRHEF